MNKDLYVHVLLIVDFPFLTNNQFA